MHYDEFNKRLDEWVSKEKFDLNREVEWPLPEKPDKKKTGGASQSQKKEPLKDSKNLKKQKSQLDRETATPESTSANIQNVPRPSTAGGKENKEVTITTEVLDGTPRPDDEDADMIDVQDAAAAAKAAPPETYTREEEIEKLRTGGSMTQNQTEISRVRNLDKIQITGKKQPITQTSLQQ